MPKSGEAMTPPASCSYLPPCAWLTLEFDLLFHHNNIMTKLFVFFLAYSEEDTSDKDHTEDQNAYHRDCNG